MIVVQVILIFLALASLLFTACSIALIGAVMPTEMGLSFAGIGLVFTALWIFLFVRTRKAMERGSDDGKAS